MKVLIKRGIEYCAGFPMPIYWASITVVDISPDGTDAPSKYPFRPQADELDEKINIYCDDGSFFIKEKFMTRGKMENWVIYMKDTLKMQLQSYREEIFLLKRIPERHMVSEEILKI